MMDIEASVLVNVCYTTPMDKMDWQSWLFYGVVMLCIVGYALGHHYLGWPHSPLAFILGI